MLESRLMLTFTPVMYSKLNNYIGHSVVVTSIYCLSGFYDYTHINNDIYHKFKKKTYEQTQNAVSQQLNILKYNWYLSLIIVNLQQITTHHV